MSESVWVLQFRRDGDEGSWFLLGAFETVESARSAQSDEERKSRYWEHRIVEYVRKEPQE